MPPTKSNGLFIAILPRWWPLWVLLAVALIVTLSGKLSLYISAASGACFDPVGTDPWPVPASGGLGMSYLQVQVQAPFPTMFPHVGVDVLASVDDPVAAIEGGMIVLAGGADPAHWIVVESATEPGFGYLYQHLQESSIKFAPKVDPIAAGDVLGAVVQYDDDADYHHLHVERVRGLDDEGDLVSDSGKPWSSAESFQNPLARLQPPAETQAPQFVVDAAGVYLPSGTACSKSMPTPGAWPFWFRESGACDVATTYHCPDALPKCVALDIVCRVEDPTGAPGGIVVAPCCVRVDIVHDEGLAPAASFDVVFDGVAPIEGQTSYWPFLRDGVLDSAGVWSQPRALYLIATNQPLSDGAWEPCVVGSYTITVEQKDAAGNATTRSMVVTVL